MNALVGQNDYGSTVLRCDPERRRETPAGQFSAEARADNAVLVQIPQRVTALTLGARSVPALRAFYRGLGWVENEGSSDTFSSFTVGSMRLALYPIELLRREAAAGERTVDPGAWNGVTLTVNVATRDVVDDAFKAAVAAGAAAVASPIEREWGGYSGYITDPEGHRWEIAWAPGFPIPA